MFCVKVIIQFLFHWFNLTRVESPAIVSNHFLTFTTNYSHIADGYSCIKVCSTDDTECLGNHTREVLYQFRAVPSLKTITTPIEVSKIVTHMGVPFSVDYSLDYVGKRHFQIVQDKNIGHQISPKSFYYRNCQLVRPIRGPTVETIKVNIHTKSRTGVILAFNEAIIEISVSKYSF
ncbi:hypothetical protein CRE_15813 [Caenorhabditis remanei]|uniref:Phlebovirus glycoprotein G2 fusion domain-containing protein n=1 Tax=Caenorhabditis remanei TaxID=31234 RepID=E3NPE2_CAERE|nr:hypothetical protein CRE_15813 [Caenorhabditis remanei]